MGNGIHSVTVNIGESVALTNQAFGCPEHIPETDEEADLLHYLHRATARQC